MSALICPQALAADAAGSGGCAHGHTLTTCRGGKSVCAVCGETVDIRAAQYTGWLTVEGTADRMYFLSGEHVTGWQQLDGGTYHFDDDGIVHDTETVDTRTCTTNGYAITTCRTCGETCRSAVLRYAGHSWDADHVCTKCGTQGKNIADAQVKTAPAVYNGKDAVCAVAVTYQGRQLTVRTDEADVDGCISYTNNTRVGLGTVSIRGMRDFYGTVSALLQIPGFRAAVGNYCHDTFLAQAQRLVGDGGRVMTGGAHLSASAAMNDRLWPLIRAGDRAWPAGTTYADTVADMDAWLTARIAQMRAAYAHTWDAGVVTRKPTCTSTGTRVYTSDAGETMTETIPARAHAPEALPAVAATCTTPGLTEGSRCALCGEVLTAQETIPAAHRYVNGVCTVCGARDPVSAPCPGGKACPGSRFTDMPPAGNWAHNAIDFTVAHKLFAGTSDTTFEPSARLTRAMIVMILYRLEGEPAAAESAFTDVRSGAWYAGAIGWAAGSGIVNGVGGGRFDPNGLATREQTAAILYRYARFKGCDLDACGDLSAFADAGSVSVFALAPMTWAVGERLISGNAIGGRTLLDPQGVTTRAQFATIMMRYILNVVQPAPEP